MSTEKNNSRQTTAAPSVEDVFESFNGATVTWMQQIDRQREEAHRAGREGLEQIAQLTRIWWQANLDTYEAVNKGMATASRLTQEALKSTHETARRMGTLYVHRAA